MEMDFTIPDLTDIPDRCLVEEGEYDLVIKKVKAGTNKDGTRKCMMLICEFVGYDETDDNGNPLEPEPVFHKLWYPNAEDDKTKAQTMLRMIKEFIVAIGVDPDGVEPNDFIGVEFSALVKIDEYNGLRSHVIHKVT